jgi:hypothetical protein
VSDEKPTEPAGDRIPMVTGPDGQPYVAAEFVIRLLRAIADGCRNRVDDPTCNLRTAGTVIDLEADAIACEAIMQTH